MEDTPHVCNAKKGRPILFGSASDNRIPFGLIDGRLVHVGDVERGLQCGCICPGCEAPLIARQGDKNIHHFAHASGASCEGAYETSLHRAAKQVLEEEMHIVLPAVTVNLKNNRGPIEFAPEVDRKIDSIELEKKLGTTIPDVTAIIGRNKLAIEVKVTHGIDDEKLSRIEHEGVPTIEINLSDLPRDVNMDLIRYHVVESADRKVWVYNAYAVARYAQLLKSGRKMPMTFRGMAAHVDNCPKPARKWHGKPYANVMDDCLYCKFNIHVGDDFIICSGAPNAIRDRSRIVALRGPYRLKRPGRRL